MKQINLDDLVEGNTYYIQVRDYNFKAVYDRYDKNKFYFKQIIRLNTPKDWIGHIDVYEYMHYNIYELEKTKIQKAMETRAINTILMNITGTEILTFY
jgi:hypothetical protein